MPNSVISIQLITEVRAPGRCTFTTPVTTRSGRELQISFVKVTGLLPSLSALGEGEARWGYGDDGLLCSASEPVDIAGGICPPPPHPHQPPLVWQREDGLSCQTAYLFIRLRNQTNLMLLHYTLSRKQRS